MLLLQERMRALERLEPTDLPRRGHLHRPPLPAEDPGAHFLPPPRQHERMNVERGGHRLHLHTTLPTEAHRGQLELGAVFLDFLRPCARHRHLPLLGGSVYKSEGGFPVSFKPLLGRCQHRPPSGSGAAYSTIAIAPREPGLLSLGPCPPRHTAVLASA